MYVPSTKNAEAICSYGRNIVTATFFSVLRQLIAAITDLYGSSVATMADIIDIETDTTALSSTIGLPNVIDDRNNGISHSTTIIRNIDPIHCLVRMNVRPLILPISNLSNYTLP